MRLRRGALRAGRRSAAPRSAAASTPRLRLELVRAAIADQPGFVVDDREVRRAGPFVQRCSRWRELRAELPDTPLCLIVGMDAFLGLPTWHRWHGTAASSRTSSSRTRPGWMRAGRRACSATCWRERGARCASRTCTRRSPGRILIQPVTQLEISSTELRDLLAAGRDPRYLVPDRRVRADPRDHGCYCSPTHEVSMAAKRPSRSSSKSTVRPHLRAKAPPSRRPPRPRAGGEAPRLDAPRPPRKVAARQPRAPRRPAAKPARPRPGPRRRRRSHRSCSTRSRT